VHVSRAYACAPPRRSSTLGSILLATVNNGATYNVDALNSSTFMFSGVMFPKTWVSLLFVVSVFARLSSGDEPRSAFRAEITIDARRIIWRFDQAAPHRLIDSRIASVFRSSTVSIDLIARIARIARQSSRLDDRFAGGGIQRMRIIQSSGSPKEMGGT